MLYITLGQNTQVLFIPRNGWEPDTTESLALSLVSTADRTTATLEVAEWSVSGHFFRLVVGLPEDDSLFLGEWEYTLTLEDGSAVTGLAYVVEEDTEVEQYNKTITYQQYGE